MVSTSVVVVVAVVVLDFHNFFIWNVFWHSLQANSWLLRNVKFNQFDENVFTPENLKAICHISVEEGEIIETIDTKLIDSK